MIGIDTNILARVYANDPSNPAQTALARSFVALNADRGIFISVPVFVESLWLLKSHFGIAKAGLIAFALDLLDRPQFHLADRDAIAAAVTKFSQRRRIGFVDCLIEALAERSGVSSTYTFDRFAAEWQHFTLLDA